MLLRYQLYWIGLVFVSSLRSRNDQGIGLWVDMYVVCLRIIIRDLFLYPTQSLVTSFRLLSRHSRSTVRNRNPSNVVDHMLHYGGLPLVVCLDSDPRPLWICPDHCFECRTR